LLNAKAIWLKYTLHARRVGFYGIFDYIIGVLSENLLNFDVSVDLVMICFKLVKHFLKFQVLLIVGEE